MASSCTSSSSSFAVRFVGSPVLSEILHMLPFLSDR